MNHPLSGKRRSEVTELEILSLSSKDYIFYTNWLVQVKLEYLMLEGFVSAQFDSEGVPLFRCLTEDGTYKLLTETQLEESILCSTLAGLGRFI